MARVKNGATTKARHKKVLKQAKGYFGSKHRLYKSAKEQLMHSGQYAFRDRKQKKREFRKLWITRINAACRMEDISYSKFMSGLNKAGIDINRKMLSEIAIHDEASFKELVKKAKEALTSSKEVKRTEVKDEVVITKNSAKKEVEKETKEESKKETKKEEKKEEVKATKDYSKMTVAQLKEVAKSKGIATTGLKKADIIAALEK